MKKPYDIRTFAIEGAELRLQNFIPRDQKVQCLCGTSHRQGRNYMMKVCTMCSKSYHGCLLQPSSFEGICCYCVSRTNDPANIVERVLNEAFFNLSEPGMYANRLQFEFEMGPVESDCRVDVRCFRAGEDSMGFPMIGTLFLNGKQVTILKPLMSNSNLKKRKDEPLTLNESDMHGKNVMWYELPRIKRDMKEKYQVQSTKTCFFLGIYLVRRLSRDELEDYVKRQSFISKEDSMKRFFGGGDQQIVLDGEKQSLRCPLTLEMIQVPVRGTFCTHFQVFCLRSLYFTQGQKGRWMCPICKKKIFNPVMDMWVFEITSTSANTEQDEMQLVFQADGQYHWQKRQENKEQPLVVSKAKPPPKKKTKKQVEIDVKEQERQPEADLRSSMLKRMSEINIEELEQEIDRQVSNTMVWEDCVAVVPEVRTAAINNQANPRSLSASNASNTVKKKGKKPVAAVVNKPVEEEPECEIVLDRPPPKQPVVKANMSKEVVAKQKQPKNPRPAEPQDGEIMEITAPVNLSLKPTPPAPPTKPLKNSRSLDQDQPRALPQTERLKRQLEMNARFNSSLQPQRIEKIKDTLTTTRCQQLTLHELTKIFERLRVRRPKKQKLFTDNYPMLFKFH